MVDVIPFTNFKEKMRIIKKEQKKNRKVVIEGNMVYSFKRAGNRECKNFKCNCCDIAFRVTAIVDDIRYVVCPSCGSYLVDYIFGFEEKIFEKQIR